MEGLLQGFGGLLRLEAITLEALLGFEAMPLSGFGVFFHVTLRWEHGALLGSVWVCGGCSLLKRS
jgi:hypothetical protein